MLISHSTKENSLILHCFFLAELRIDVDEGCDEEGSQAADNRPDEEVAVSNGFLQPACHHAWQHHPQCHEACADGIVSCFMFTFREVDKIKHVRGKAKSVAELLNEDTCIDDQHAFRLGVAQKDINQVGQGDGAYHGP